MKKVVPITVDVPDGKVLDHISEENGTFIPIFKDKPKSYEEILNEFKKSHPNEKTFSISTTCYNLAVQNYCSLLVELQNLAYIFNESKIYNKGYCVSMTNNKIEIIFREKTHSSATEAVFFKEEDAKKAVYIIFNIHI